MKTTLHQKFMKVVNSLANKKIEQEPIQTVILGGSVARGDETKHSDIDIVFYVKKKDLPENKRGFYKYKGKYIEEHYSAIENLKNSNLLPEEKIIYDKTGKIKIPKFNEKLSKKKFNDSLKQAKKFQKLAEGYFKKGDYEKSFYYLYSMESPSFVIMHSLPPRFNLPFPSFRLLGSIRIIDKKHKTKIYKKVEKIYTFENKNKKQILRDFQKAYLLMNKIKKSENLNYKNLGFFDKIKIKYNVSGLKETFKSYPFVYAYRFIVGCLSMWAFDKKIKLKYKSEFKKYLLIVLGIKLIDKKLIKEKLNLSNELIKECEKLK